MKIFSSLSIGIVIVMVSNILSQNDDSSPDNTGSNSETPTFVCKADQSTIEIVMII